MPNPTPSKLQVDFSNVEDRREGGRSIHVPEGDYLMEVAGCELRKKKDDETSKYLSWKLRIIKPAKYKNLGFVYFITSLKEESLWNLRNFLEDLGLQVPKKAVNVPIQKIVEEHRQLVATLVDDEYNDKVKSKVAATAKAEAYEESAETEDEEEEEVATPAKSSKKAEEDEDEEEDEDLEEIDVEDL